MAEAKPLLLNRAVFNVDFNCFLSKAKGCNRPVLRVQQGFTQDDLALVHSLEFKQDFKFDEYSANEVMLSMPCLRTLTIVACNYTGWKRFRNQYPIFDGPATLDRDSCRPFGEIVRRRQSEQREPGMYKIFYEYPGSWEWEGKEVDAVRISAAGQL